MEDAILQIEGLIGGYGEMTILNGATLAVPRGAITTVIGPNGAGKSTLLKAVFGLLRPRSGRILFDGRDIVGVAQRRLIAAGLSYVPQGRNIFPELSVRHNLELGLVAAPPSHSQSAQRLEAAFARFPALRDKADRQASILSGGEQKQLEIARGLLLEPKLVMIDEPSIGLSPRLVRQTFDMLTALRQHGTSVLIVEQNARSALEISDYGVVLELGRVRIFERADRVLADPRVASLFLGAGMADAATAP